ncbi:MAG: DUF1549 and DUF1553 domain-containing protein [Planctomycetaceae bacterium]
MSLVIRRLANGFVPVLCVALIGSAQAAPEAPAESGGKPFSTGSSDKIVKQSNALVRQGWRDNEISPSPVAGDAKWLRRVYLDIVGHIPPAETVAKFLANKDPEKRTEVIDSLLDDPAYVRNWVTVWTNLAIGRRTPRRVSRVGMRKFFREAFARNRPWNEIVFDLVSAEGRFERNGAVNYLLAQMTMRDNGVQATAKTTRLFLGMQVQCTQCHDHPFNKWKQTQFWEFNSFFRQAQRRDVRKYNPKTGRREDLYSELVRRDFSGPVYFENRQALVKVAYPKYFDRLVDDKEGVNRRKELAKLMTAGEKPLIARAMVNRMWGHFFGYGFTKPVDDMGPHNPPSHPELLDLLTTEFVKHRYDLKQLVRWICNSEAYNLSSAVGAKNKDDNPAAGATPLFSHMYVKSMTAEQLYDSLIIATEAHKSGRSSWAAAEKQRQRWMQQFVVAFDTDENDESTTFNGTIPQALMMMNGPLTENAVNTKPGSFLFRILSKRRKDGETITRLYFSALGRKPSRREMQGLLKLFRSKRTNEQKLAAYQDLYWALLNSNEFIFVH